MDWPLGCVASSTASALVPSWAGREEDVGTGSLTLVTGCHIQGHGGEVWVRYELTRLGSAEFEHLSQALGIAVLGPAVSVFGAGPDGGREATWNGRVDPAPVPASECWDGAGSCRRSSSRP